jgi:hypothetical protein
MATAMRQHDRRRKNPLHQKLNRVYHRLPIISSRTIRGGLRMSKEKTPDIYHEIDEVFKNLAPERQKEVIAFARSLEKASRDKKL